MLLMKSKKIIFALSIVIGLVVVLVYSLGKKEKIKRKKKSDKVKEKRRKEKISQEEQEKPIDNPEPENNDEKK